MLYRLSLSEDAEHYLLAAGPWVDPSQTAANGPSGDSHLIVLPVESYVPSGCFFDEIEQYCRRIVPSVARDRAPASGAGCVFRWPRAGCERITLLRELGRLASPERLGRTASGYTDLVFRTPLYRLNAVAHGLGATVLVKLESMEPGSVKDRAVTGMVRAAIERGELTAETEVVEASSGNVAFALAAVLRAELGRKPLIFISRMHGPAKTRAVRSAGCPVVLTPAPDGSRGAKEASVTYAARSGAWELNQHGNPDNPATHRRTTGPELYHQCFQLTGQAPAEFVSGLGSGGTAVGVALFRDDIGAGFKVIGVEPAEASLLTGGTFHAHGFSGIAPGFVTPIVERDRRRIDGIETISREEGYEVCRRVLTEEGLLVGPSSGASIAAALRRAALPENCGKVIVTIAHDRGDRYLDVEGLFEPPEAAFERDEAEFSRNNR